METGLFILTGASGVGKTTLRNQLDVYFSDFLKHKGLEHYYKCKQRIHFSSKGLVEKIVHMELPGEREKLNAYYQQVGL